MRREKGTVYGMQEVYADDGNILRVQKREIDGFGGQAEMIINGKRTGQFTSCRSSGPSIDEIAKEWYQKMKHSVQ